MRFHGLARKRLWRATVVAAALAIAGAAWAACPTKYTDLSQLPSEVVDPSLESRHEPPFYGTRVRFEPTAAAFARAGRENKLVLVLHLSGRFDSSETT